MDRRVERCFPDILRITGEVFKDAIKKDGIPSEYKGYISTFGAMVLQNGVLPALAFFEKEDNNANQSREKIADIMKEYLVQKDGMFSKYKNEYKNKKLVELIVAEIKKENEYDREKLRIIENKLIDISIATKLALRTYLNVSKD